MRSHGISIMIILYYLSFVHLGLQQKVYAKLRNKENNNELLDLLNNFHPFTEKYIYNKIFWNRNFNII